MQKNLKSAKLRHYTCYNKSAYVRYGTPTPLIPFEEHIFLAGDSLTIKQDQIDPKFLSIRPNLDFGDRSGLVWPCSQREASFFSSKKTCIVIW